MKKIILWIGIIGINITLNAQETVQGINFHAEHSSYNSSGIHDSHIKQWNRLSLALKSENNSFRIEDWTLGSSNITTIFSANTNGKVGIGTTSPIGKLHIETDRWSKSLLTLKDTHYSPHQVYNFQIESDGLKIRQDNVINYQFKSGGNFIVNNGKVGIGTTTPDSKLSVNGNIHTKEIKVETGWSDFVFEDEYKLPTLKEVENHIKEKGHLKDIPSAKEVEKNGIFLGEMDAKLLQKIEELTLYTIQQQKEIENIKKENKSLKNMNSKFIELQKRLEKLENK